MFSTGTLVVIFGKFGVHRFNVLHAVNILDIALLLEHGDDRDLLIFVGSKSLS